MKNSVIRLLQPPFLKKKTKIDPNTKKMEMEVSYPRFKSMKKREALDRILEHSPRVEKKHCKDVFLEGDMVDLPLFDLHPSTFPIENSFLLTNEKLIYQ